jgi:hypothetical protein
LKPEQLFTKAREDKEMQVIPVAPPVSKAQDFIEKPLLTPLAAPDRMAIVACK